MDEYPVLLIHYDGRRIEGRIQAWEESLTDKDCILLRLSYLGNEIEQIAEDYFTALTDIRVELEKSGWLPAMNGASLNIFPSPMSRKMGNGEKAYKLTRGQPARTADLVSIFDSSPEVIPSTVAEQERNYQDWLASLKK